MTDPRATVFTAPDAAPGGLPHRANPFKGLVPYEEADADWFFGRDREIRVIRENLRASSLTVVYGASGVGKTSLLRAGVIHGINTRAKEELRRGRHPTAVAALFNEWSEPTQLRGQLVEAVRAAVTSVFPEAELEVLGPGNSLAEQMRAWSDEIEAHLLVVLDQFEEYFRYAEDAGEDEFTHQLAEVITAPGTYTNLLFSLREDRLAKLDRLKHRIPGLLDNYLRVDHLLADRAIEAVIKPLQRWNKLKLWEPHPVIPDPGLISAVLVEVGVDEDEAPAHQRDEPEPPTHIQAPLLQLVLTKLWDREVEAAGQKRPIELQEKTFRDQGGAGEIMAQHFAEALEGVHLDQLEIAESLFDRLVTPSLAKTAARESDLIAWANADDDEVRKLLARLVEHRILDVIESRTGRVEDTRYALFHDVLGRPMRSWVDDRRDLRARIKRDDRIALSRGVGVLAIAVFVLALTIISRQLFWLVLGGSVVFSVVSIALADEVRRQPIRRDRFRTWGPIAASAVALSIAPLALLYTFVADVRTSFVGEKGAVLTSQEQNDLGGVPVGESVTERIPIQSTGSRTVRNLTLSVGRVGSGVFDWSHSCRSELRVDEACAVNVTFQPVDRSLRHLAIDVRSDGDLLLTLVVTGNGLQPDPTLSVNNVNFSPVPMQSARVEPLTITNHGNAAYAFQTAVVGVARDDFDIDNQCPPALGPSDACDLVVQFTPNAQGYRQAELQIVGADGTQRSVGLSGYSDPISFEVFPKRIDHGAVPVGGRQTKSVNVTNGEEEPVVLGDIGIRGANQTTFQAFHNCPTKLEPGEQCSLSVEFEPREEGDHSAELTIGPRDGLEQRVQLAGTGTTVITQTVLREVEFVVPLSWRDWRGGAFTASDDRRLGRFRHIAPDVDDLLRDWDTPGVSVSVVTDPNLSTAALLDLAGRPNECSDRVALTEDYRLGTFSGTRTDWERCAGLPTEFAQIIVRPRSGEYVVLIEAVAPTKLDAADVADVLRSMTEAALG